MKQQNSNNGLFDEPDFSSPSNGGGAGFANGGNGGPAPGILQQEALINKFNNTVVLKKGQLTQVLKNTMAMPLGGMSNGHQLDVSPQRGLIQNSMVTNGSLPRRNSRNVNKNQASSAHKNSSDQFGGGFVQQSPHHMVGGPEIANGDDQPLIIGKAAGSGSNGMLQLDHFQYISTSAQPHNNINMMNQTIRSPQHQQQQQNLAAVISNIKNNGSLRNLQNFRSKRIEKVQQQQLQYLGTDASNVRAPPIQNGLYFSNIISVNGPQSQRYHNPNQQQLAQQQSQQVSANNIAVTANQTLTGPNGSNGMILSPRQGNNNSKSNAPPSGGNHQKAQSLGEVTGIIKNIMNSNGSAAPSTQMPNIIMTSPRNNNQMPTAGNTQNGSAVSIERINKNISDSIKGGPNGPHNKEIQLIQAYQHQKWKEQITQRKNKNVALRSLDTTYQDLASAINTGNGQQNAYAINTSREPSTKPQIHGTGQMNTTLIGLGQTTVVKNNGAVTNRQQQPQRVVQQPNNGSLTSRQPGQVLMGVNGQPQLFADGVSPTAGQVFSYHDSSTYSSTIEDESRMMKTQIKFPMSSQEAFKILQPLLWDVEKTEILEFETVYFFNVVERKKQSSEQRRTQASGGSNSTMMIMGSDNPKLINFGFDNESQEYNVIMHEHLAYRYEVVKKLGKGSFGIVLRVFDHKTKEFVALKILKNKKRLYKQGLVEAKLIENLNKADPEDKKNIIRRLDQFVFRKHLMITFEMLSINLYEFIKMNNFQGFSLNLIKRFAIQILIALFFMKEHNIVHCDMKPENILLRKINKSGIKIIDFGSGCFENEKIYTYIQSRFYRAPEIVLGIAYTTAIDMWSYGCILYELFVGYPLFPGEDEKEHMAMIMEVKGVPPRSVLARATRRKVFFDDDYQPILVANSRGKIRNPSTKSLAQLMNCQDRDFVDFVDKCIEWKVENRLTPEQAFSHPFIAKAVQELKGIRGQSETQKGPGSSSQQQPAHPAQTVAPQAAITAVNNLQHSGTAQTSNSETLLPQINYKS